MLKKSLVLVSAVVAVSVSAPAFAQRPDRDRHDRRDDRRDHRDDRRDRWDDRRDRWDDRRDHRRDDRRYDHRPPVVIGPVVRPGPVVIRPNPGRGGSVVIDHRGRRVYRPGTRVIVRPPMIRVRRHPSIDLDIVYRARRDVAYLGSTFLDQRTDYDVIPVNECGIRAVQLRVKRADASIDHVIAVFADGSQQELDVREYFEEGSHSGWKDLPGYSRCVRSIIVVGDTDRSRYAQAEVDVFGLR